MPLKIEEITDSVFHVIADTQYDISSTFLRVQEFYESPFKEIRKRFFTHEQCMDLHAHKDNIFSYFEDWAGFNIPGNVFDKWVRLFGDDLWDKEKELVDLVYEQLEKKSNKFKFYVIGSFLREDERILDHELSHAWFYLDPEYKQTMLKLARKLPKQAKAQLKHYLKNDGYTPEVFNDEIIAYLATNPMSFTAEQFEDKVIPWDHILKFQETFEEFKEEKLDKSN